MDGKKLLFLVMALLCFSLRSEAALVELTGMLAYSKAEFADGYKSTQNRYSGSIAFKFTPVSAIEFEYVDSTTKISSLTTLAELLPMPTREDITYRDKIYSFNWVQNLVSTKWIIQPYFVIGGGKMIRNYVRMYPEYGLALRATQSATSGTGGLGLRIFLTRNMAIKTEVKTYVPNFRFSKWKESQMMSAGLSWTF